MIFLRYYAEMTRKYRSRSPRSKKSVSASTSSHSGGSRLKQMLTTPQPKQKPHSGPPVLVQAEDSESEDKADIEDHLFGVLATTPDAIPRDSKSVASSGRKRPPSQTSADTTCVDFAMRFQCWICGLAKDCKEIAQKIVDGSKQECLWCNRAVGAVSRSAESQGKRGIESLRNKREYDKVE